MPVSPIVGVAPVATSTAHPSITPAHHTTTDSPLTTPALTFPVVSPTNMAIITTVATAARADSEIAITSTAKNSKQPTKRVRHLITSGAFTRQSLPDSGMPKGSTLEIEVGKLEEKWQRERSDVLRIASPIRYQLLLERFKSEKGLLPAIAEGSNEDAVKTFAFYPSCLGKLEIRDDRGVLLGYRFHVEKEYLITLSNSDQMLPERRQRKKGGGGDPIARGVFDTRHYTVWADYGNTIRENRELEEDRPASTQWIKSNTGLFHALSHQLRMLEPEAYVHLTKAVKKKMSEYRSSTGESLFPFAGAWHGVCINRGQQGKASSAHQDWMDLPTGFNCVVPYGSGFTGANLILMQLKMQIQLSIGEGFLFRGAIIAHKVSDIESGFRNSIDLFAHKSTFDIVRKANERAKKKFWDKSEGYDMSTSQPMSFYSSVIHVLLPLSNPTTPNASQPRSRYYETEIAIPEANTIPYQLINTENIEAVLVSYIVDKYNQPKHGQLCTVSGRFFATNDKKNLLTINSYTANIFRSDLDYSSDIYQQSLPEPYSAIVTVIGKVHNPNELPNHSTISNKCRTFEVETAAYFNAKLNSFKCLVIMPTDLRFGSTPLPFKDTFVCCHAIIIGIDEETSHLAILLKDFTYLPTTSNESVKSQDSTTTPEKKVFQWGKRDKKVADSAVPSVPKHNFESLKQQKPILNRRIPTAISKINKLSENTKDTVQPIKAKSIPRKIYGTGRVSKSLKGNTPKAVTRITRNSVNLKDNLPSVEKEVGSNNENSDTELSDVLDLDSENIALDDCCTDTVENDDLDVAGNGNLHGNKLLDAGTGTENKSLRVHNEQALKE